MSRRSLSQCLCMESVASAAGKEGGEGACPVRRSVNTLSLIMHQCFHAHSRQPAAAVTLLRARGVRDNAAAASGGEGLEGVL